MILKSNLFEGLDQEEISRLESISVEHDELVDRRVITKGEFHENIFVLIQGKFQVYELEDDVRHVIAILQEPGDCVGGQSLLGRPANTNVTAAQGSRYFAIAAAEIKREPLLYQKLLNNLSVESFHKLEAANYSLVEQFKEAIVASKILVMCLSSIGVAMLFLSFTAWINFQANVLWSWLFVIAVLPPPVLFIASTRQPFSDFGVTIKNVKQSVSEGFLLAAFFVGLMSLVAHLLAGFTHVSVSQIFGEHSYLRIGFYMYFVHCYMQEFFARGVLQTSLIRILGWNGRRNDSAALAILFAALVFSVLHYPLGFPFVLATFISGLLFGYLYQRHKNLLGVSLVHFAMGKFLFGFYYAYTG